MGISVSLLLTLLIDLIKNIFSVEQTNYSGPEKERIVLSAVTPTLKAEGNNVDWFTWFQVLSQIIKAVVDILNNMFGKDWGKPPDAKK